MLNSKSIPVKVLIENTDCLSICDKLYKSINIVVNYTKGIGERKGNLLKYVNLYGQFINISETWHVLKSQTAAIMPKRL